MQNSRFKAPLDCNFDNSSGSIQTYEFQLLPSLITPCNNGFLQNKRAEKAVREDELKRWMVSEGLHSMLPKDVNI